MGHKSNAERQREYRERQKASGLKKVTIALPAGDLEALKVMYNESNDHGSTWNEFLHKVVMRGAAFTCNAGRKVGSKVRKVSRNNRDRYAVTKSINGRKAVIEKIGSVWEGYFDDDHSETFIGGTKRGVIQDMEAQA